MTIGNRISELRKAKGYTQEYIADQLGVSRQAVSKWEQDQSSPDTGNLIALSKLLGTSVEYLATGDSASVADKAAYHERLEYLIEEKKAAGCGALVAAAILFFVPYIGWLVALILLIIGIVNYCKAGTLKDELYLFGEPVPQKKAAPDPSPWRCYSCAEENPSAVGYCTNCGTNKAWSLEKQAQEQKREA